MKRIIKRERISNYFIDSAKKQILLTGIEGVSVRKVAEDTGYSYATIYNYYKDLNELLWSVKKVMIQDLIAWMTLSLKDVEMNQEGIKKIFHLYVNYYFDNPNVFKFFYFYPVKMSESNMHDIFNFNDLRENTFSGMMKSYKLTPIDVQTISMTMIYVIHGILTLHFSQNGEHTYASVCLEIDNILDYLVR